MNYKILIAIFITFSFAGSSSYFAYQKIRKKETLKNKNSDNRAAVIDKVNIATKKKENKNNQPLFENKNSNHQETKKEEQEEKWYLSWKGELFFSTTTLLVFFIAIVALVKGTSKIENIRKTRDNLISQTYNRDFEPFINFIKEDENVSYYDLEEKISGINNQVVNVINGNLSDSRNVYNTTVTEYHEFLTILLSIIYVLLLTFIIAILKIKNKKGIEYFKSFLFIFIKRVQFFLYSLPFILIEYIVLNFAIKKIFVTDNEIKMDNYINFVENTLKKKANTVIFTDAIPIKKLEIPYIFIPYEPIYKQIKNYCHSCCFNFIFNFS